MCYSLFHGHEGAGSEVFTAGLLHWSHGLLVEGQVRERGEEDPGGRRHSPGQAPGGDGRPLHVPQHQGQQVTATYQGLSH